MAPALPFGYRWFSRLKNLPENQQKIGVFLLTFLAYSAFHASRKPPSIVKSALLNEWAPFNGKGGKFLLGAVDLTYLLSYAVAMFFTGGLGDRIDMRNLLTTGMIGSAAFTALFGMGYFVGIHTTVFYLAVQAIAGVFQSIGWPVLVAIIGVWLGKSGRKGVLMGIWNSHASVGNVIGSLVASGALHYGWGWAFIFPAAYILAVSFVVLLLLVPSPAALCLDPDSKVTEETAVVEHPRGTTEQLEHPGHVETLPLVPQLDTSPGSPIRCLDALRLPGVGLYALALFFAKMVPYTLVYWLPYYLSHTAIEGENLSDKEAGIWSIVFDLGGIAGGVLAGFLSDKMDAPAATSSVFLLLSLPTLFSFHTYGSAFKAINITLLFATGALVNGPYSLISTAVATDLASHGNSRALATVSAILDGTGSIGAAVGPFLAGYLFTEFGWDCVFWMLMVSNIIATGLLFCLLRKEIQRKVHQGKGL